MALKKSRQQNNINPIVLSFISSPVKTSSNEFHSDGSTRNPFKPVIAYY